MLVLHLRLKKKKRYIIYSLGLCFRYLPSIAKKNDASNIFASTQVLNELLDDCFVLLYTGIDINNCCIILLKYQLCTFNSLLSESGIEKQPKA